jgi:hypothetical protein
MNSFDSAVARMFGKWLDQQIKDAEDVLLLGVARDWADYQNRTARYKALKDCREQLLDIEAEIKRG